MAKKRYPSRRKVKRALEGTGESPVWEGLRKLVLVGGAVVLAVSLGGMIPSKKKR